MNIQKNIDYSDMYAALDAAISAEKQQMKLYCKIGKAVYQRCERGAAVAAAAYPSEHHQNVHGFSPRNLRRMRDFYRAYEEQPTLLPLAFQIGWTQNVVIMEADLPMEQLEWYLKAEIQFGWSKAELTEKLTYNAHEVIVLAPDHEVCYTAFRVFQTLIAGMLFLCMIGLAYSGIILSRHVLKFLLIEGGRSFARILHMLCAYWGFVLMGIHLGLHWNMVMGIVGKGRKKSATMTMRLRILSLLIAGYGSYAFSTRQVGTYMLHRTHFVFFDYDEPLIFFFGDYGAILALFIFVGHWLGKVLRKNRI